MLLGQGKFEALNGMTTYLAAIKNTEKIKWGVDEVVKFREQVPENFRSQTDPFINSMVLKGILAASSIADLRVHSGLAMSSAVRVGAAVQNPAMPFGAAAT